MLSVVMLTACIGGIACEHYQEVPPTGMDRRDTLMLCNDTIGETGIYNTVISVRTDNTYPYTNISLGVEQKVFPAKAAEGDSIIRKPWRRYRTVECSVVGDNGKRAGSGIIYKVSEMQAFVDTLHSGDSVVVRVFHNMRRETMPGITHIGVKISE